ncbi:MAG: substrate-binding domain-containing protein [Chloroflexi bacterium]|nr:substrate-binding domain-containing protein [Chloroflexota bacterium]
MRNSIFVLVILGAWITACAAPPQTLTLATTTSTYDTGLLDAIIPKFEAQSNARVKVIAVGTGQALKLGSDGNADVVLVHAREQEDAFVRAGDGINRREVMYNDFVVVGAKEDPAKIADALNAADAFKKIALLQATFVSRGDNSGTQTKEKSIWATTNLTPTKEMLWYQSIGQGMSETLIFANEKRAYTLTDRGTWLALQNKLPNLALLVGGATLAENKDKTLLNPYGVIPVNPAKHPNVNAALAEKFAAWITSPETQKLIGDFGKDKFGQALFYPNAGR